MAYNAQLMEALKARPEDHERVLRLIQSGADVNFKDSNGVTPLNRAACCGHYETAKTLLEHGARINPVSDSNYNYTPLMCAIFYDHENVVRLLLEKGADPHIRAGTNGSALEIAISENKNTVIVELLIEHGADVNENVGQRKETPLHRACEKGNLKVVQLLIEKGARKEVRDADNQKPVHIAKKKNFREIVEMLEKKFPLWLRLYHASKVGDYEECKELLEQGVNVKSCQYRQYCPLAAASKKGHANIVQLLLEKGAIINCGDDEKRQLLNLAMKHGHTEIVSLLLENAGVNAHAKINGETLLHVAVKNNSEEIVRLLIERELVNPNIEDNEGCAPLHHAALNGNLAIVTRLLNASANVYLANNKTETPLHLACQGAHLDIVQLLLEKGAQRTLQNEGEEKPVDVVDKKKGEIELETKRRLLVLDHIKQLLNPQSEMTASSEPVADQEDRSLNIESNEDSSGEDSDATVDYSHSIKNPFKPDCTCGTLTIADIEELNNKMARLSSLILELNEHAMNAELIETDLAYEAETLKHLNRQVEQSIRLKRLKSQDVKAQMIYEDKIVNLTRRMDESRKKEAEMREEIERSQTEVPRMKAAIKSVYREIGRVIDKIKVVL